MGSSGSWNLFSFFRKNNPAEILPLVEQHVPKDGVIIDASAGAGKFTTFFSEATPQGHVYAFEPGKHLRAILSKLIAVKKLANVSLFPMGLGDNKPAASSCPVMNADKEQPAHTTIDEFTSLHGLKKVDFIRSDAQISVLMGARGTLNKFRPVLFLATNDDGETPADVKEFLEEHNYRVDRVESNGKRLTPLEAPATKGALLCVAEERA